jgi:hypothetical protein
MNIEIVRCDPSEWGGSWGYSSNGSDCFVMGYKTKKKMLEKIIKRKLGGDELGELCLKLLLKHKTAKGGDA